MMKNIKDFFNETVLREKSALLLAAELENATYKIKIKQLEARLYEAQENLKRVEKLSSAAARHAVDTDNAISYVCKKEV